MKRFLSTLGAALLMLLGVAPAAQAAHGPCPDAGGTQFVVNTPAEADSIAAGYHNEDCDLVVTSSVTPTVADLQFFAKSFQLTGATIINPLSLSAVHVTVPGAIDVTNGEIRARNEVHLRSTSQAGSITAPGSVLVASSTLDPFAIPGNPSSGPAAGGNLTLQALGPISVDGTVTYAGSRVHIIGGSTVAWVCGGSNVCQDPASVCPDGFPCSRTYTSVADVLAQLCQFAHTCGGGANEVRVTATGDIMISGTFNFLSHATLESTLGSINASGTVINSVTDLQFIAGVAVDLTGVTWTAGHTVRVTTKAGCTAPSTCITATSASVTGGLNILFATNLSAGGIDLCAGSFTRVASGFPRFNNDVTPPYPASVKDDAVECAPLPAAVIQ